MPMVGRDQRIRIRHVDSPVKLDGTIIKSDTTGKVITVQFDGPLPNKTFVAISSAQLVSDGFDRDNQPTLDYRLMVKAEYWEVL